MVLRKGGGLDPGVGPGRAGGRWQPRGQLGGSPGAGSGFETEVFRPDGNLSEVSRAGERKQGTTGRGKGCWSCRRLQAHDGQVCPLQGQQVGFTRVSLTENHTEQGLKVRDVAPGGTTYRSSVNLSGTLQSPAYP